MLRGGVGFLRCGAAWCCAVAWGLVDIGKC